MPEIFKDASGARAFSREQRRLAKRIALVPTMGFLHEGHLSLIKAARELADCVFVSIYVNPTQFAQHEDFGVYPRDEEGDLRKLESLGVDALFQPESLYATGDGARAPGDAAVVVGAPGERAAGAHETYIQVEQLQQHLCGQSRPHFFRGVATVVAKLFNIIEPDVAVFGRKDYQQLIVLTKMARDLDFAVEVVGLPIQREADGLAMSSRNALLTPSDRQNALSISRALQAAKRLVEEQGVTSAGTLLTGIVTQISNAGGIVDYVKAVHAHTLKEVQAVTEQSTVIAVAAFFGRVRLIDNLELACRQP